MGLGNSQHMPEQAELGAAGLWQIRPALIRWVVLAKRKAGTKPGGWDWGYVHLWRKFPEIRTFPHIGTCLPTTAKFGVFGAQLLRFEERSSFGINFMDNAFNLIIKMIRFGYNAKKMLAIVKKFNK